jgi:hypothetical protein
LTDDPADAPAREPERVRLLDAIDGAVEEPERQEEDGASAP